MSETYTELGTDGVLHTATAINPLPKGAQRRNDGTVTVSNSTSVWWIDAMGERRQCPGYLWVEPREKKEPMRGLFEVFIVDPNGTDPDSQVPYGNQFVARDAETAKVKAWTDAQQEDEDLRGRDPDDFDFIVHRLGDVRPRTITETVKG